MYKNRKKMNIRLSSWRRKRKTCCCWWFRDRERSVGESGACEVVPFICFWTCYCVSYTQLITFYYWMQYIINPWKKALLLRIFKGRHKYEMFYFPFIRPLIWVRRPAVAGAESLASLRCCTQPFSLLFFTLVAMTYLDFTDGIHNITACITRPRESDTTERL